MAKTSCEKTGGAGSFCGGENKNPFLFCQWYSFSRSALPCRKDEYTKTRPIRVHVMTWNVGGQMPSPSVDLTGLLQVPSEEDQIPDMLVLGFQELVNLTPGNVANAEKCHRRAVEWIKFMDTKVEQLWTNSFKRVIQKHLVGIFQVIYVKTDLAPHIRGAQGCTIGLGVLGMLGNKGAVSLRFQIFDTSFCFVCSHLAAHRENLASRNADVGKISTKTIFCKTLRRSSFRGRLRAMIKKVPLMQAAPDSFLDSLINEAKLELVVVDRAITVMTKGDYGDCMYFVQKGELEVFAGEAGVGRVLCTLGSSDYFGEMALLAEQSERSATVRTKGAVEMFRLGKDDFNEARKKFPEFDKAMQTSYEERKARSEAPADQNKSGGKQKKEEEPKDKPLKQKETPVVMATEDINRPLDHDYVVWFGDLNYRVSEALSTQEVYAHIDSGPRGLSALGKHDQLRIEMAEGTVFAGFEEGDFTRFQPTYKYEPGTARYMLV
jgi:CRP-like cAMP-binding protein